MAIFNEVFLDRIFKKKKNNKTKKKFSTKSPTFLEITNDDIKVIEAELKKIVKKYNSDSEIKKNIEKDLSKYYDEMELEGYEDRSHFTKFHPFVCKLFERNKSDIIYEICNEGQEYRCAITGYISDIGNELETILKNNSISADGIIFSIDNGDGDEGCIYIDKYKKINN